MARYSDGLAGMAGSGDTNPARPLQGVMGMVFALLALATVLFHLYANIWGTVPELQMAALHFGLFGLLCAFTTPMLNLRDTRLRRVVLITDAVLGCSALLCALYLLSAEDAYYARGEVLTTTDWLMGGLAILLALEFTRRTTGWIIPILTIIALSYAVWWGALVEGVFNFPGLTPERLLYRAYFTTQGLFGTIAAISWSFVFMFLLFGAFLLHSGAGAFIIDLARLVAGRVTGGAGFVAIMASGLMGSVTGSAVANTVSTGAITIPMMKRAGFPPRLAAGVEAAASTGGQLMPPVMGAGAFIMATFTGLSYLDIIAAATVPALLYFLSVAIVVRITARKEGLGTEDPAGQGVPMPSAGDVMRRGWPFLIPLTVLVVLMVMGFTATYAAGIATVTVIAASWLSPTPMGVRAVAEAAISAVKMMIPTAMLLVSVGLIVMIVTTTGVGNTISLMITTWAGGDLLLTMILVALASLILGMGLPVTAAYIVLATLAAPALQGLIVDGEIIRQIAAGTVPDMVRGLLVLGAPEQAAALGSPMSQEEAKRILDAVPPEFMDQIRTQMLDPARVAAALLSAHMIIFWLSQDSNVTPPVCLTAFAAAGIAGTPAMATGLTAWRVAKGLYLVPLLLAYTPLIGGSAWEIATAALTGLVAFYALSAALDGWMEGPIGPAGRAVATLAGVVLLWPDLGAVFKLAALALVLAMLIWSILGSARVPKKSDPAMQTGS